MTQCYASTADKTDDEAGEFYKQLDHVLTEIRKKNVTMLEISMQVNARQRVMSLCSMDMVREMKEDGHW